jgi:hypothetical protein
MVKYKSLSGKSETLNWFGARQVIPLTCNGTVFPEDLLVTQYTHLNYAFAFIDPNSYAVAPMAELDKQLWPRFTALKKLSPGLQTWASNYSVACPDSRLMESKDIYWRLEYE